VASVELRDARKAYPNGVEALRGVDLGIADGELMVLVGSSGCGKTTALRAVAGLERLSSGAVLIDDVDVGAMAAADRDVAMVFQSYGLYPHMSVARNVAFGLRARRVPRDEQRERVLRIAKALDIEPLLDRRPRELSGGQRQRVAMGRALVRDPRVFLMDEPLSNLDARLRVQMRGEIVRIQQELGTTTIYVTHDQVEAMTMGQRVAVMDGGQLRQVATPERLYETPANLFVARFMGSPPINLLIGAIVADGERLACRLGETLVALPDTLVAARPGLRAYAGRELIVGVRPDAFALAAPGAGSGLPGKVDLVERLGSESLVHVEVEAAAPHGADGGGTLPAWDAAGDGRGRLSGRFPGAHSAAQGDGVALALDAARLELFDRDSGDALERSVVQPAPANAPPKL
jgi:multiple sugar transport system ATP-binding protein